MEYYFDFIHTSGREHLPLNKRGVFLRDALQQLEARNLPPNLSHRIRLAATYAEWDLKDWAHAISKVECEVMAWMRGGEAEWVRVVRAQVPQETKV